MKSRWWLLGLLICLTIAGLSPLASSSPDGLERVAEDRGFAQLVTTPPFKIIADYIFPGIKNEAVATVLAGLTGTLFLFAVVYALAWLLTLKKRHLPG